MEVDLDPKSEPGALGYNRELSMNVVMIRKEIVLGNSLDLHFHNCNGVFGCRWCTKSLGSVELDGYPLRRSTSAPAATPTTSNAVTILIII
ncbi:hypothetical protein ACS0TY_019364 [Phlomoides rotata]